MLQLIAEGMSSRQIAQTLQIQLKTVDSHRTELMRQLGIHDVSGIVRYAIRNGLVPAQRSVSSMFFGVYVIPPLGSLLQFNTGRVVKRSRPSLLGGSASINVPTMATILVADDHPLDRHFLFLQDIGISFFFDKPKRFAEIADLVSRMISQGEQVAGQRQR